MQTKGGGKHDILPVARSRDHALVLVDDAPRSRCGHVPRRFNDAAEHGEVRGASELRSTPEGSLLVETDRLRRPPTKRIFARETTLAYD